MMITFQETDIYRHIGTSCHSSEIVTTVPAFNVRKEVAIRAVR